MFFCEFKSVGKSLVNKKGSQKKLPNSDRARIRTWDRLLRRQMLYPAELRDQLDGKNRKKLDIPIIFSFYINWKNNEIEGYCFI